LSFFRATQLVLRIARFAARFGAPSSHLWVCPRSTHNALVMKLVRHLTLVVSTGLALAAGGARAWADSIYESNNTVGTAAILPSGQLVVMDDLNGNAGRPDTVLGLYDAAYSTLLDVDNDGSTTGNGTASQLTLVPLDIHGGAYFRHSGYPDTSFITAHSQLGQYYVQFDLYTSAHAYFKTLSLEYESVEPGFLDNVWVDPPAAPEPERIGGFVTATVQNIVGPGTGDSLDFFWFTGLGADMPFEAELTIHTFDALLAWFGGPNNQLITFDGGPNPKISGIADGLGRALIAVSGGGDNLFKGEHAKTGDYTLLVTPVPEPASIALAAIGTVLAMLVRPRRRK
jgi:hypothetical protein